MSERLYSDHWFRIGHLKPRLRSFTKIHRQTFRGEIWYVIENSGNGNFYRLANTQYKWVGLLDGARSMNQIWDEACELLGDQAPTQDQIIHLLIELHNADILLCDCMPNIRELGDKRLRSDRDSKRKKWLEPFCWRLPIFDPSKILLKLEPMSQVLFSRWAFMIWMTVTTFASVIALIHWGELSGGVLDTLLSPNNILWFLLLFPALKILHELGHALAVVKGGGQVREMGIMLIAFVPLPYVDASSASAFQSKKDRMVVGAAGMGVEVFIASLCLVLWSLVEPGIIRGALYSVILTAGIATLLFNLNPLLKFDAYYILSDWIEIPNLCSRSRTYLLASIKRLFLRLKDIKTESLTHSVKLWFWFYGCASVVYRFLIFTAIILFVWNKFYFIGVFFAIWGGFSLLLLPIIRLFRYLSLSPELQAHRARAWAICSLMVFVFVFLTAMVPFPKWTVAEGIIVPDEESLVRTETSGFVSKIIAVPDSQVSVGDPLLACREPEIESSIQVIRAKLSELEAKRVQSLNENILVANHLEDEIKFHQKRLQRELEKMNSLTLKSQMEGTFVLPNSSDILGTHVNAGTLIAHVINPREIKVRVIVPQKYVDQVRNDTVKIRFKLVEDLNVTYQGTLNREVPTASMSLPSAALGTLGGGRAAIDPKDASGLRAVEKHFQFDLDFKSTPKLFRIGGKVVVRFEHEWEPLALRWYRDISELFLGRLHV